MGGPPGIPGNPRPAEPTVPGFVELGMVPVAGTVDGKAGWAAGAPLIPPEGSRLLSRLDDEGFCGFAEEELFCAKTGGATATARIERTSRRTRITETSLASKCPVRGTRPIFLFLHSWCARRELNPHAIADPGF